MRERESITLTEAARILGLSYHNLYMKCRQNLIPGAFRIPGKQRCSWRITVDGLKTILENRIDEEVDTRNENTS